MYHSRLTIFVLAITAVLVGVVWSAGAAYSLTILWSPITFITQSLAESQRPSGALSEYGIAPLPAGVPTDERIVPKDGTALRIDTERKVLAVFQDGTQTKQFALSSVPDVVSPWFAPTGRYTVHGRARTHASLIAGAETGYTLFFGENSILHAGGEESFGFTVPRDAAAEVFALAEEGMPVIVLTETPQAARVGYRDVLSSLQDEREEMHVPQADAYLLGDTETGELLVSKNEDEALPIASVSKLMTARVARRLASQEGGVLTEEQKQALPELIYTLILRSSNVAAERIADMFGREYFMERMNARAEELGFESMAFTDPSGLSPGNAASARDLFRLVRHIAQTDPELMSLSQEERHETQRTAYGRAQLLVNHNRLVRSENPYFIGGKVGYTPEAKQTAAAMFRLPVSEHETRTLAAIVLGSDDRSRDLTALLSSGAHGTAYGIPDFHDTFAEAVRMKQKTDARETIAVALAGSLFPDNTTPMRERLAALGSFKTSDAFILSLEGVAASQKGYNVRGENALRHEPDTLDELAALGADALVVSNGHAGDWGRGAFDAYMDELGERAITPVGGGENIRQADRLFTVEKNGITVGMTAVSDAGPVWLSEEPDLPMILSARSLERRVRSHAGAVDHLMVGIDFDSDASHDRRRTLARSAVDAGAAVVVGFGEQTDPFYERYGDGIIFYGLGEFTGPESEGVAAEFVFDRNGVRDVRGDIFRESEDGIRRLGGQE